MMNKQLSEKWASFHIVTIGLFYVISGIWVYLLGASGEEGLSFGDSILSNIYSVYTAIIGPITVLTGIFLLLKLNFSRLSALILAWWNLFTGPLIDVYWNIHYINTKGISKGNFQFGLWLDVAIIILIMTAIRLYIIYMLRPSKAGYIFLKKGSTPIKKGS